MLGEVLIWLLIGAGVGSVLGLTGAGGAIFSVPLFINFVQASPKEATVLALITVVAGSLTNTINQRYFVIWKYSLVIGLGSIVGSLIFFQVKLVSPDWVIATLFLAVALFGAASIWRKQKFEVADSESPVRVSAWLPFQGALLGGLATMTGLGGGLILVPWLKSKMKLPLNSAVATSLGSISIISLSSLIIQSRNIPHSLTPLGVGLLVIGVFGGSRVIKSITKRYEGDGLNLTRKFVFSLIIVYAVITLSVRS